MMADHEPTVLKMPSTAANLDPADQILWIDPAEIEVRNRVGFYFPDKAVALGRLIASVGQRDPIKVIKNSKNRLQPWRLVVGRHRLEGVLLEDLRQIQAIEVFGDQAAMRDMEASENLHRRPLAPIERAMFVHALCEAARDRFASEHGDLSNQQAAIKLRWARVRAGEIRAEQAIQDESNDTADKMSAVFGWQESAADALGLDARTIRRSLEIYRLLVEPFPDLIRALADHPVVGENGAQLRAIAAVKDEAQRRAVIEALLGNSELSADEARVAVGIDSPKGAAEQPVHQKYVNAVTGNLARLTASLQKRHLPSFVTALKSDEVKRELRDLLNKELGDAR